MRMCYKEDWDQAARRMEAWWAGEVIDRACIAVTASRGKPGAALQPPKDDFARWADPDYLIAACEAGFANTYFGGEAFPTRTLLIGYAALGNPATYVERTIWTEPVIERWSNAGEAAGQTSVPCPPKLTRWHFDPQNDGWQATKRVTETLVEAGAGKWMVSIATVPTPTDALSSLRGPERLCVDLVEHREHVVAMRDYLADVWFRCYDELHRIIQRQMRGSTSWLPVWSPGRTYTLQCDFSCMISPRMFREFVIPELEAQTRWLTHTIYHLDGPGAVQHLDALLELPRLNAIQWVPGAGAPPPLKWLPLLKRIQQAGKGLHISIAKEDVEAALAELSPKGLFIATSCKTIAEADALLRMAARPT